MSEVQSRPSAPRGRGSSRGARGGHGARGGARGGARHKHTGEKADQQSFSTVEDEGEIGELKKKYASPLSTLRELFPDWTDDDLVFALQETDGDLESTIERITEGSVSQWGKVEKKSKEKARSKSHDPSAAGHDSTTTGQAGRGGRTGRGGHDGAGRTGERGRGSGRGGRGGSTAARVPRSSTSRGPSSDAAKQSATSDEAWSWVDIPPQATAQTAAQPTDGGWDSAAANKTPLGNAAATTGTSGDAGGAPEANKGGVIPTGAKKSWASIFAKPVPVPVVKPTPPPALPPQDHAPPTEVSQPETEALPPPPTPPLTTDAIETPADEAQAPTPALAEPNEPEVILEPSKDKLTESNVEQVLDTSAPPISNTQASTIATSQVAPSGAGTPYSAIGQLPTPRPPLGGFASSAYRAAGTPGRSASFQRRILDQQEAVVMPSNHAVDRAAVQFGSMGLNGVSDEQDVDEDREEAETRAQPPQHSPVAHPVASLPPAPHQSLPSHQASSARDAEPTPRQTPGLPIAPQQQPPTLPQAGTQPTAAEVPTASQPLAPDNQPSGHPYAQLNRFAQSAPQQDQHSTAPKVYDPFGQHATQNQSQQSHYDGYPTHAHAHAQAQQSQMQQQQQQQQPSLIGGSTALNNYSSYYTSDQQSRAGYPNYYSAMYGGQQSGQMAQEASAGQQRPGSGIGQSITDSSHYPASQAPQAASRYGQVGEAQASGGSTPNPSVVGQHAQQHQQQQQQHQQAQASQAQPSQSMQGQQAQAQAQATGHSNFPFGQPYYSNPYYAYMNSYNNYNQGYGAPFGGKAGHYAQPSQGYGIAPQSTYEHSSSPVNVGGYGQASLHGRDTGLGGAVSDYARTGSSQAGPNQAQTGGSAAFGGGIPDVFGRSGFPGHNQPLGQHHGNAQSGADDALKAFGDSKVATGPSPALNHSVAGRADTAGHNSNAPGVHQPATTLAASQSQQAQHSYGGYHAPLNPHHHLHHGGQTTQYGNLGGLGGHPAAGAQSHQAAAGYGGYPANYAGNYYAGGGRGGGGAGGGAGAGAGGAGWSGNYGH